MTMSCAEPVMRKEKQVVNGQDNPSHSVGFSMILETAYGRMILNRHDLIQTVFLLSKGISPEHREIELLAEAMRHSVDKPNFVDIGANFGTYSLAMARAVPPGGRVYAFEPQRIIFNMLAGSVALNSLENLFCYHMALGDRDGEIEIPQFDYHQTMNFGSVEFGPEQKEKVSQQRRHDPAKQEMVPLRRLDSLGLDRIGMIKIDVEGMEEMVVDGAMETIARCRPLVYLETMKSDAEALRRRFREMNYQVNVVGNNDFYYPSKMTS